MLDLGKNHSWWAIGKWIHFLWKFMFPQGTHSGEWEVKIVMQPARDGEKQPPNWWVFSRRTKANWKSSGDDSNGISDKLISNWLVLYCEDSILHLFVDLHLFVERHIITQYVVFINMHNRFEYNCQGLSMHGKLWTMNYEPSDFIKFANASLQVCLVV